MIFFHTEFLKHNIIGLSLQSITDFEIGETVLLALTGT